MLPEARRLIFAGKYSEANSLVGSRMMARPIGQMQYQTLGDLILQFPETKEVKDYRRDLNLDTAIATTSYTAGGVRFTREAFAKSGVNGQIVVHLTADKPGQISFTARLKTPHKATVRTLNDDTLALYGVNGPSQGIAGTLKFAAWVRIMATGGKTEAEHVTIAVQGADSVVLLIDAATSYKKYNDTSGGTEELLWPACTMLGKNRMTSSAMPTWPTTSGSSAAWPSTSARPTRPDFPPTSGSKALPPAQIRGWPPSISSMAAICSSVPRARAASRPRSRASGTTA